MFFHVQSKHIKTFSFFCSCFVLNFTAWQPRLGESFMERSCRVSLLCDRAWSDPKLDAMYRSAAQAAKAWVFKKQTKKMGRFLKKLFGKESNCTDPFGLLCCRWVFWRLTQSSTLTARSLEFSARPTSMLWESWQSAFCSGPLPVTLIRL